MLNLRQKDRGGVNMNKILLGLIIGLVIAIVVIISRYTFAKKRGETFFLYDLAKNSHDIKKRTRNLYTWTIFGIIIGLVFIIPSLNSDQTKTALIWTYTIGFALIFLSLGSAYFIYRENKD